MLAVQNENICAQVRRCNARAPTANIRSGSLPKRREMLAMIGKVVIVPKNKLAEFHVRRDRCRLGTSR